MSCKHGSYQHALLVQKDFSWLFHPKPNGCLHFDLESCNLMCTCTVPTHACDIPPLEQACPMMLCIYTSISISGNYILSGKIESSWIAHLSLPIVWDNAQSASIQRWIHNWSTWTVQLSCTSVPSPNDEYSATSICLATNVLLWHTVIH